MDLNEVKEIINLYFSKKKDKNNDYILSLNEEIEIDIVDIDSKTIQKQKTKEIGTGFYDLISKPNEILKEENIKKLSPDNINNKFFWSYIVEKFPCYSISQYPNCKNEEDVNKANLNAAIWNGSYNKITSYIKNNNGKKILEIGPGYGNIFYALTKDFPSCNYFAIDVNPLFYYDGLFECDGKSIPNEAGSGFGLIFSFNTFQHLSKNQRSSYYKDIYEKLELGGKFIFTNFLIYEKNRNIKNFWPYIDEKGNRYNSFLSQLTEIDEYESLADELNEIGFSIKVNLSQKLATIECEKI